MENFLRSLHDRDTWIFTGFLLFIMFAIIFPFVLHRQRTKEAFVSKWKEEDRFIQVEYNGKHYPMRKKEEGIWKRMGREERREYIHQMERYIKSGHLEIVKDINLGKMLVATEKGRQIQFNAIDFYKAGSKKK